MATLHYFTAKSFLGDNNWKNTLRNYKNKLKVKRQMKQFYLIVMYNADSRVGYHTIIGLLHINQTEMSALMNSECHKVVGSFIQTGA
jgi:predicted XRE-type DNA-binding protein